MDRKREESLKELQERIDRGDFPLKPPTQEEVRRLDTDDDKELAKALEKLAEELGRAERDSYAWKWVILALFNAIQSAIVRAISGSDQCGALRDEEMRATREWLDKFDDPGKGEMPQPYLASFGVLFKRAKKLPHAVRPTGLNRDLKRLTQYRNQFIHYAPLNWTIILYGLPEMVLRCLDFVESIMPGRPSGGMQWLEDEVGDLAEASLVRARTATRALEKLYNTKPPTEQA